MFSTRKRSLRDVVKHNKILLSSLLFTLSSCTRIGLCVVDETEKGWFVQYVDRDPETLRKMEAAKSREKHERDDEERLAAFIEVATCIG